MILEEIIEFVDKKIPKELALDFDNVGFSSDYDLNKNITSIKLFMDLIPQDDNYDENTLIITHHPPLFKPETPTYTIHSNWDIIDGGANDALCELLKLDVIDYFDKDTHIGRICNFNDTFEELKKIIHNNFDSARIVTDKKDNDIINKIGVISGFGLKNPEYIKLAKKCNLDVLISGDLTQETAILAKNLEITLIDLGHHESEVAGLFALKDVLDELNVNVEIIDKKPIEKL